MRKLRLIETHCLVFLILAFLAVSVNTSAQVWEPYYTPSSRHNCDIHAINKSTFTVIGGNESNDSIQTVSRSFDGGESWHMVIDIVDSWLMSADYINDQTGYACGFSGVLIKTDSYWDNYEYLTIPAVSCYHYHTTIAYRNPCCGIYKANRSEAW